MGDGQRSAIWDLAEQEGGPGSTASGHAVHTSIASAEEGWTDGGGSGGLRSDKKLWSTAAEGVGSLRGNLKKGTAKLEEGQKGLSSADIAVTGFASGAAQLGLFESWERYLDLVSRECGELGGKLEKAGDDHYKNDEAIGAAFQEQRTKPEDPTPPEGHGGHPSTGGHPSQGR